MAQFYWWTCLRELPAASSYLFPDSVLRSSNLSRCRRAVRHCNELCLYPCSRRTSLVTRRTLRKESNLEGLLLGANQAAPVCKVCSRSRSRMRGYTSLASKCPGLLPNFRKTPTPSLYASLSHRRRLWTDVKKVKRRVAFPLLVAASVDSNLGTTPEQQGAGTKDSDWRSRAKPIRPGSTYPAKEHCSQCGLCDTYYVAHVKDACAFLGEGMSRIDWMEERVHGHRRHRGESTDEFHFGVHKEILFAKKKEPVLGAQWTGIVTTIAVEMLRSGKVEAVVCVQSDPDNRFQPYPVLARTPEEVLAARGVKPMLSPNLNTLALVEAAGVKRLLFCGVGCQVQALRSVEHHLGLEKLYTLGTNCVDNGTRQGFEKFLSVVSDDPATVLHYEFMQDFKVHVKHTDGHTDEIPYFCLPSSELNDVIAPSCYSCFDYANGLADLVVGYMGVPKQPGVPMTRHPQYVVVRNDRGVEMLDLVRPQLETTRTVSEGDRRAFVMQTVEADDKAKLDVDKKTKPMPRFVGNLMAFLLEKVGPKGLEFARFSLDYHTIRNYLYVHRVWGKERADSHVPLYAKQVVDLYNRNGEIDRLLACDVEAYKAAIMPPKKPLGTISKQEPGFASRRVGSPSNAERDSLSKEDPKRTRQELDVESATISQENELLAVFVGAGLAAWLLYNLFQAGLFNDDLSIHQSGLLLQVLHVHNFT
ncbi:hypothetical protein CBR_g51515 [Chara braunii]|uniref:Coenzyme F420 hydrogenase/dehydrogenase beta subunit C-terminal domain-containing protein n=1 Tax=Chara braunii TaxID=69332 RepID=A0A388K6F7_CHABU|nr:hypothetical protein CBR_g51515 [Chara braunii]|eukprot:GBG65632.1 hypothetical protein CBR_g51515 [Chara braunii]